MYISDVDYLTDNNSCIHPLEAMSEPMYNVFNLVPELALIDQLPPNLQKRFKQALNVMHKELAVQSTWQQVAEQSSISRYHFHRQFSELFNETPGQYLIRMRLRIALNLLLNDTPCSVMDIAHNCGFSSSQALGKALKRELGVTAKQVRKMSYESKPNETAALIAKVAHPGRENSLETELALFMPVELNYYPQRGVKKLLVDDPDWGTVLKIYGNKSRCFLGVTPVKQLNKCWQQIDTVIGNWQVDPTLYDFSIPEGKYLCAEVYLNSEAAYIAVIEALFLAAEKQQLIVDNGGFLIEVVRDFEVKPNGGLTLSIQLPVRDLNRN
ncbi:AraC family transcriptional regulator [Aliivibrio sp. S2TY2]|nr:MULTISPECIES: helix-turn-helix domain-containing protein [Aliivibrio]MDD9174067.1 AraC family transcriptional regulator [Aliivibrio sp. S3TY1]MDD9191144.1 AraC family transcriptional regulator [Aliivibrio sp. S2TY2]